MRARSMAWWAAALALAALAPGLALPRRGRSACSRWLLIGRAAARMGLPAEICAERNGGKRSIDQCPGARPGPGTGAVAGDPLQATPAKFMGRIAFSGAHACLAGDRGGVACQDWLHGAGSQHGVVSRNSWPNRRVAAKARRGWASSVRTRARPVVASLSAADGEAGADDRQIARLVRRFL
jgi:hypothetical protein